MNSKICHFHPFISGLIITTDPTFGWVPKRDSDTFVYVVYVTFDSSHFSYGLLFGLGCAMVRETSTLMLSQYFKRRRDLVETLATSGTGVGIAIFANVYNTGVRFVA